MLPLSASADQLDSGSMQRNKASWSPEQLATATGRSLQQAAASGPGQHQQQQQQQLEADPCPPEPDASTATAVLEHQQQGSVPELQARLQSDGSSAAPVSSAEGPSYPQDSHCIGDPAFGVLSAASACDAHLPPQGSLRKQATSMQQQHTCKHEAAGPPLHHSKQNTGYSSRGQRATGGRGQAPGRGGMSELHPQSWFVSHPMGLRSAAEAVLGQEMQYTSFHGSFLGAVDYIWFAPQVCQSCSMTTSHAA